MDFDVQGIYTVANKVLPDGAATLQAGQQRIANAHLAGDPFKEDLPSSIDGELMFQPTQKAWNDAFAKLQEAMTATVAGINFTCQTLIEVANTYQRTELTNTDSMNATNRLLDE